MTLRSPESDQVSQVPPQNACRLAYDGKGNARIREMNQLEERRESLGGFKQGLYAEEWSPFVQVRAHDTILQ